MNKVFLTDVDGVLLKFEKGFAEFLQTRYAGYINLDYSDYQLGMSHKEMKLFADQFNISEGFSRLEPYDHAIEYTRKIHDELGYKFIAITTCLGNSETQTLREKNLMNVFGDIFDDVICLPMGQSKKPEFLKFKRTFWVDDKQKHVTDAHDAGHVAFQMKQLYNEKDPDSEKVLPVRDWKEIYEFIKNNPID